MKKLLRIGYHLIYSDWDEHKWLTVLQFLAFAAYESYLQWEWVKMMVRFSNLEP